MLVRNKYSIITFTVTSHLHLFLVYLLSNAARYTFKLIKNLFYSLNFNVFYVNLFSYNLFNVKAIDTFKIVMQTLNIQIVIKFLKRTHNDH